MKRRSKAAPAPQASKAAPASRPRQKADDPLIAEARDRWVRGLTAEAIAKLAGRTSAWVYLTAKKFGWPPRGSGLGNPASTTPPTKPAKAAKAAARQMTPERECDNCGQKTVTDPCEFCEASI